MTNPLCMLRELGQSVWLDFLARGILDDGTLQSLIDEDGLAGMTSNPSIFEKAIGETNDYDDRIAALIAEGVTQPAGLYERLAIDDIQDAAHIFRPMWDRLAGADGYVSLEVSPHLADDTEGTIAEARRLWQAVSQPNVMIKVPGTPAGYPAIRRLIADGVNVNVTLLFGIPAYLAVAEAHMAGLEDRKAAGGDIGSVHGVASFFVSRIDTAIDKAIDTRLSAGDGSQAEALRALRGKVAIANAKIAYQHYLELVTGSRWRALQDAGARPQRVLWASTGTKDPAYPDVLYAEALIGPDTIDTLPPKTLNAFRHHGHVAPTLIADVEGARQTLAEAERLGLDLAGVTERLTADGVRLFAEAFDTLLAALDKKRAALAAAGRRKAG